MFVADLWHPKMQKLPLGPTNHPTAVTHSIYEQHMALGVEIWYEETKD